MSWRFDTIEKRAQWEGRGRRGWRGGHLCIGSSGFLSGRLGAESSGPWSGWSKLMDGPRSPFLGPSPSSKRQIHPSIHPAAPYIHRSEGEGHVTARIASSPPATLWKAKVGQSCPATYSLPYSTAAVQYDMMCITWMD